MTADRNLLKSTFLKSKRALPLYMSLHTILRYICIKAKKFQQLNPLNETESRYLGFIIAWCSKILLLQRVKALLSATWMGKITVPFWLSQCAFWYDDKLLWVCRTKMMTCGYCVKIIMMSLDGKQKEISATDEIAMYPTTAASVAKIAYNTLMEKLKLQQFKLNSLLNMKYKITMRERDIVLSASVSGWMPKTRQG